MDTDVVVVGYGGAGATAAITAHDNGASVVILEKMPIAGGNSRVFGGNVIIPKGMEFANYLDAITCKTTDRDIINAFVEGAMNIDSWVSQMGGGLQPFQPLTVNYPPSGPPVTYPNVPGAENVDHKYTFKGAQRAPGARDAPCDRWWKFFSGNVQRRGIKVMLNTPAKELIKNQKGEIAGVIAESAGKRLSIKARKGVILTCGGFENNDAMKLDYSSIKAPLKFQGNPGNTGDGIKMVQKVGGDLWHMTRMAYWIGFQAPEYEAAFTLSFLSPRYIFVDKYGRRFVDEMRSDIYEYGEVLSMLDTERFDYPRVPFYAIFDEEVRRRGPLCWGTTGYNKDRYKWSLDNSAEIKQGWIIRARTIPELAKRLSMHELTLGDTISKYNETCKVGRDSDFGRAKESLKPIKDPYYAIQVWPSLLNTQGGPRRDREARVLDPDGKPIPRLYAAGELGSIWGYRYNTSTNMAECIVFGQIAGRNAATSSPVES